MSYAAELTETAKHQHDEPWLLHGPCTRIARSIREVRIAARAEITLIIATKTLLYTQVSQAQGNQSSGQRAVTPEPDGKDPLACSHLCAPRQPQEYLQRLVSLYPMYNTDGHEAQPYNRINQMVPREGGHHDHLQHLNAIT